MRKLTISLLTVLAACAWVYIATTAFNAPKCDHVFVQVEQDTVNIEQPKLSLGGSVYQEYSWPSGKQEGKELICVKCFHKQKQVIDYGEPVQHSLTTCCDSIRLLHLGALFLAGDSLRYDTLNVIRSGSGFLIGGNLHFDTAGIFSNSIKGQVK